MGSDTYRSEIVRLEKDRASVQSHLGKQEDHAAKGRAEAAKKRKAACDAKLNSMMQSNLRSVENEDKKVVDGHVEIQLAAIDQNERGCGENGL